MYIYIYFHVCKHVYVYTYTYVFHLSLFLCHKHRHIDTHILTHRHRKFGGSAANILDCNTHCNTEDLDNEQIKISGGWGTPPFPGNLYVCTWYGSVKRDLYMSKETYDKDLLTVEKRPIYVKRDL